MYRGQAPVTAQSELIQVKYTPLIRILDIWIGTQSIWVGMDYTLDDLKKELAQHDPGYGIGIDLPTYGRLFPPGEPYLIARKTAQEFAMSNNCTVHYETYPGSVFFRKKRPNEAAV